MKTRNTPIFNLKFYRKRRIEPIEENGNSRIEKEKNGGQNFSCDSYPFGYEMSISIWNKIQENVFNFFRKYSLEHR